MSSSASSSLLPLGQGPRVVLYHQTHHKPNNGPPISALPLVTNTTGITHIIVAAIHLNEDPQSITLNDHHPDHARFDTLWQELAWLQASGVKVLGMLGGAARGSYARLDMSDPQRFETYYNPLRDMIRKHRLDGLDLDIEEPTTTENIVFLIDRLRQDFGPTFLITLAPVAAGLLPNQPNCVGPDFNYQALEAMRGHEIAWYNVQHYNGWGSASDTSWYDYTIASGWKPEKIVLGLLTNPGNGGSGFVGWEKLESVLRSLRAKHANFGGVMGWEYFNALPGQEDRPWEWAAAVSQVVRSSEPAVSRSMTSDGGQLTSPAHPYPAESVKTLVDLGVSQQQAISALNSTSGNVEYAAGLLFQD